MSEQEWKPGDDLADRLWSKVDRGAAVDCWLWTGSFRPNGYGYLRWHGLALVAHRIAYEMEVGEIPEGAVMDHLCRVRACVNPAHLEAVANRVNVLRGEGVTAANSKKTHCSNEHAFTTENTYWWSSVDGSRHRQCRECQRQAGRRRRASRVQEQVTP